MGFLANQFYEGDVNESDFRSFTYWAKTMSDLISAERLEADITEILEAVRSLALGDNDDDDDDPTARHGNPDEEDSGSPNPTGSEAASSRASEDPESDG